jgi:hypothetical protein
MDRRRTAVLTGVSAACVTPWVPQYAATMVEHLWASSAFRLFYDVIAAMGPGDGGLMGWPRSVEPQWALVSI